MLTFFIGQDKFSASNFLSLFIIASLSFGALWVLANDPYRLENCDIHHPRTHATLALLIITIFAVPIILLTIEKDPPFIFMAFFIGIMGAALGVLQRLDFQSIEANLLFQNLPKILENAKGEDALVDITTTQKRVAIVDHTTKEKRLLSTQVQADPEQSFKLHQSIVQQIYISISIGGILGVFGLIVMTAFNHLPLLPEFSIDSQTICDTIKKSDCTAVLSFDLWVQLKPINYGYALFVCILFGYAQRLSSSILNRAEDIAGEFISSFEPGAIEHNNGSD